MKKEITWSDYLGIEVKQTVFLTFEESRAFAISLKLKSREDWYKQIKNNNIPKNIRIDPTKFKEWKGWGYFLGTSRTYRGNIASFKEARKLARSLNLKNRPEWQKYCTSGNKPNNIPNDPYVSYRNKGWTSWGDFLGTGNISPSKKRANHLEFEEARSFARSLNLGSKRAWKEYWKNNDIKNIPANPNQTYSEWISWADFLGKK